MSYPYKYVFPFEYNGIIIILEKMVEESYDSFYERGYIIVKTYVKGKITNLSEIKKLAFIYTQIKYNKCVYSESINNKLKELVYW